MGCAVVGTLAVSGCAGGGKPASKSASAPSTVAVVKVDDIAAALPGDIKQSGTLRVAVDVPFPPAEFKNDDGELVGFDVDLMDAVATTLGLTVDYQESDFPKIIPAVVSGDADLGMSSITDNKTREKLVDFVTYFSAGTQWAQRPGSDIDPKNACGKRVAVKSKTVQATEELPAKNKACMDAGKRKIEVFEFLEEDAGFDAVVIGKVDAMTADSPVTAYAINQSDGKLQAAGAIFDTAPYGWPVKKDSLLGPALLKALESLIKSGAYKDIATKWGLGSGMIEKPVINGAVG